MMKKRATRLPEWWFYVKGYFHAKKGEEVCNSFVEKLIFKTKKVVGEEVTLYEKKLVSLREKGRELLSEKHELLEKNVISGSSGTTTTVNLVDSMRERKNSEKAMKEAQGRISEIKHEIAHIKEHKDSMNVLMDYRITNMLNDVQAKTAAYVHGVRAGGIKQYDNKALSNISDVTAHYYAIHKNIDEFIDENADAFMNIEGGGK